MGKALVILVIFALCGSAAWAVDAAGKLEAVYSRAVIEFNSGQFDAAVKTLDSVIAASPQHTQALELKALALKAQRKDAESLKSYGELIKTGPPTRKAKYYYEVASILHRAKRYSQARPYFNAAIAAKFNVGASHFFLGLIDYEDKLYDSAEKHLRQTIASNANDLKPLANFYLGLIYYRSGYAKGSIRGLRYAYDGVYSWKDSADVEQKKMATDIMGVSRKLLKNLDRARLFGNIGTSLQYDSNVAFLPGTVTTKAQLEGKSTVKQLITGGVGIATSSARLLQAVASYRLFFNFNYNDDSKNYDFLSHIGSVYLNFRPYAKLTPGLKAEGTYTFQNVAGREDVMEMHPYGLMGNTGGYVNYEILPRFDVRFEGGYKPKLYYNDVAKGTERRSGDGYEFRLTGEHTALFRFLNPSVTVAYERDDAEGKSWQFDAWSVGVSDLMKISRRDSLVLSFDVSFYEYPLRVPRREDDFFQGKILWAHELIPQLSLLVDFTYASNDSNLTTLFSYSRAFGGVGATYSF